MKKKTKILNAFLLLLIFIFQISGCFREADKEEVPEIKNIKAFVSILPQAELVRKIGGEQVEVSVLIPPGTTPEDYELSSGQLKALSEADVYFMVGHLPFEKAWYEKIKSVNPDLLIVDTSRDINIIDDNPHIWLSLKLACLQADNVCKALVRIDPENKSYYEENNKALKSELKSIDEKIAGKFAGLKNKIFITYHPAWTYFAQDYGLKEIAIEEHGKEPTPQDIARIIKIARENNVKTIFATPQHSTRSAEAIAREINGKVELIDPLPSNYNYMLKVAEVLAQAMEAQKENGR
ncbi:zinc ABC transporter substrate-binding protein [Thermosyntropha sp.]|uniref:metal ABC transporter solute-binding protein, Zn/Mn family n=1 Tax=Thermosyntropha sp. TaxID=2740820 RepID=UPI0025F00A02|nr:zinc ABC transporter substrate-binding protein [Thermosyntropha sp.]MBO8158226.1 zinc ABC transporter substrate-binding protein [Thermosyntropha sp.]